MGTIRNFPFKTEHTLEWAEAWFERIREFCEDLEEVTQNPREYVHKYVKSQKQYAQHDDEKVFGMRKYEIMQRFEFLSKLVCDWPVVDIKVLVNAARQLFQEVFYDLITSLLKDFPEDYRHETGELFWSGRRRCPGTIEFDPEDELHLLFISSFVEIFAEAFKLSLEESDKLKVKEMAKSAPFVYIDRNQPKGISLEEKEIKIETTVRKIKNSNF